MENPNQSSPCRRRAVYALKNKPAIEPVFLRPEIKEATKEAIKGQCPKCLKHIGRGVHFHVNKCNGN